MIHTTPVSWLLFVCFPHCSATSLAWVMGASFIIHDNCCLSDPPSAGCPFQVWSCPTLNISGTGLKFSGNIDFNVLYFSDFGRLETEELCVCVFELSHNLRVWCILVSCSIGLDVQLNSSPDIWLASQMLLLKTVNWLTLVPMLLGSLFTILYITNLTLINLFCSKFQEPSRQTRTLWCCPPYPRMLWTTQTQPPTTGPTSWRTSPRYQTLSTLGWTPGKQNLLADLLASMLLLNWMEHR